MRIIERHAYARAGLVGNPSDGYYGKTISVIVRNFWAKATLYDWDEVEIILSQEEKSRFRSVEDLVHDVGAHGYYGGVRLVKATIRRFVDFCREQEIPLHRQNFSLRYESNIPRQVGLAGSSAIIIATLRALMEFYGVETKIPLDVQPSLALSVETEELGLAAGLQDRVIQVYEGLVYMDFARDRMHKKCGLWCGDYEPLDPELLPPLYVAYSDAAAKPIQVIHNDLQGRFQRKEPAVVQAMEDFARLTVAAREALLARDAERLGRLMNENFDLRKSICRIAESHQRMIDTARRTDHTRVPAKFAGSGGAIVGICPDDSTFARLKQALESAHCKVVRPIILPPCPPKGA